MQNNKTTFGIIFAEVDRLVKGVNFNNSGLRVGRRVSFSDRQMIKMLLVRDFEGIAYNRELVRFLKVYFKRYFPVIPNHSTFCRREKKLLPLLEVVRQNLLDKLDVRFEKIKITDTTPIPVARFSPYKKYKLFPEASFGYCAALKERYKGFKLNLLTTISGIPTDFDLMPANSHDSQLLEELIDRYQDITIIADKGYCSQPLKEKLKINQNLLITPTIKYKLNKSKTKTNTYSERQLLKKRNIIESTFNQLKTRFNIVNHQLKTLNGLIARVFNILFTYTLIIFINKKIGRKPLCMQHIV